jgi:hypothetical protein
MKAVNDHLRDVAEKNPPKGGKSHDQCWDLGNPKICAKALINYEIVIN